MEFFLHFELGSWRCQYYLETLTSLYQYGVIYFCERNIVQYKFVGGKWIGYFEINPDSAQFSMENFGGIRVIFLWGYLVTHNLKFFGTIMNVTDRFVRESLLHTLLDVSLEGTQPSATSNARMDVAGARAKTLARAMAVSRPSSGGRHSVLIRINPDWRFRVHQLRKIVWFQRTTELWNYIAVESVKEWKCAINIFIIFLTWATEKRHLTRAAVQLYKKLDKESKFVKFPFCISPMTTFVSHQAAAPHFTTILCPQLDQHSVILAWVKIK